jgi:hypothetical protein
MSAATAAANRSAGLATTLRLAQQDEGCGPQELPLLFRVDGQLAVAGGRRYLIDCGGRGECHEVRGTLCLQHLTGVGKAVRGDWGGRGRSPDASTPTGGDVGCGGGGDS